MILTPPASEGTDATAAIIAALNVVLAPAVAYEYSKVPGSNGNAGEEPESYVLVDVARRYVDSFRAGGGPSSTSFRLGTRYVAKRAVNARTMRDRVTAALEGQILTTADAEFGPFTFETSDPILPDNGFQVGTDTWTF